MTSKDLRLASAWPARCATLAALTVLAAANQRPARAPDPPPPRPPAELRSAEVKPDPTCDPACKTGQTCCAKNKCCAVATQAQAVGPQTGDFVEFSWTTLAAQ